MTAADLLNRTVFYKVGHHGSHNATLKENGLDMMAKGAYEKEFVAMIPAHKEWAHNKRRWRHPLEAIHEALLEKGRGKVFLIDGEAPQRPPGVSKTEWKEFEENVEHTAMYIDYTVDDL